MLAQGDKFTATRRHSLGRKPFHGTVAKIYTNLVGDIDYILTREKYKFGNWKKYYRQYMLFARHWKIEKDEGLDRKLETILEDKK